jgi:DNA-binding beta-propeller fold protein YncE
VAAAKALRSSVLIFPVVATILSGTPQAADALSGERSWVARYDGHHRNDIPTELAVSPDGSRVFVAGTSYTGGRQGCGNYSTVAYDTADGSELWARQYNGALRFCDDLAGVVIADQGKLVVVTGNAQESDAGDIVTIAYDAVDGSQVWLAREMRPFKGADAGTDIAASPDGSTVYIAGTIQADTACDPCPYSRLVAAYDASSGARRWIDEYEGADGSAFASALTVNAAGDIFVTGPGKKGLIETVAYDGATDLRLWTARAENDYGAAYSQPATIATSSDGLTVFVAAFSKDERYSVTAYAAADGSVKWRVAKGSSTFGYPYIAVSPVENTVFFAAESREDGLIVAFDGSNGAALWRTRYEGIGLGASPRAIAVSTDGTEVMVAGNQGRHKTWIFSMGTVVLAATNGAILWADSYGRRLGGYHYASDIGAGPDGNVYVTGESEGPTGWSDFATIKYMFG